MNQHTLLSIPLNGFLKITFGFLCSTLVLISAIQLASGQEPEAAFGAMAVFQLILFQLIFALLVLPIVLPVPAGGLKVSRRTSTSIVAAGFFLVLAGISIFEIHDYLPVQEFFLNFTIMLLWIASGGLLFVHVTSRTKNRFALTVLGVGVLLQLALSFVDIFGNILWPESSSIGVETVEAALSGLVLVLFAVSLLASLLTTPSPAQADVGLGAMLSKAFFKAEYGVLGATLSIASNNAQFAIWRRLNRGKSFADFYAWQITRKLNSGRAHRTLGNKQFKQDNVFSGAPVHDAGEWRVQLPNALVDMIMSLGLQRGHTLVDYGCGSLRIGKHFIMFLDKNKYWGLDVTDRFFTDGLELLGDQIRQEKQPRCRVISSRTLSEVRHDQPDFIVSVAVLKHVPENELEAYFDALTGLMTDQTVLIVTFSESTREDRISGKSWSWSLWRIENLVKARCPDHSVRVVMRDPQKSRNGIALNYCVIVAKPKV